MGAPGAAAASWGPGRLDLFEIADGGSLRHRAWLDGSATTGADTGLAAVAALPHPA